MGAKRVWPYWIFTQDSFKVENQSFAATNMRIDEWVTPEWIVALSGTYIRKGEPKKSE